MSTQVAEYTVEFRKSDPMGKVIVDCEFVNFEDKAVCRRGLIPPEQVRRAVVSGIVDTGAMLVVLPEALANRLGLEPTAQAHVRYADGQRAIRGMVDGVELKLLDRSGVFKAIIEPDREQPLIGAVVLETLDFLVDCTHQTLRPRDPDIIITEIE